jgi:hypothetical protein
MYHKKLNLNKILAKEIRTKLTRVFILTKPKKVFNYCCEERERRGFLVTRDTRDNIVTKLYCIEPRILGTTKSLSVLFLLYIQQLRVCIPCLISIVLVVLSFSESRLFAYRSHNRWNIAQYSIKLFGKKFFTERREKKHVKKNKRFYLGYFYFCTPILI